MTKKPKTPEQLAKKREDEKARYQRDPSKKIANAVKWKKENPERFRELRRSGRQKKDQLLAETNPEKLEENKRKTADRKKRWYENNRKKAMLDARLRARQIGLLNEILPGEWEAIVEQCNNTCIVPGCRASPVTQDHVIPLHFGGRHHVSNLQPLCRSCNSKKGIKTTDYRPSSEDDLTHLATCGLKVTQTMT